MGIFIQINKNAKIIVLFSYEIYICLLISIFPSQCLRSIVDYMFYMLLLILIKSKWIFNIFVSFHIIIINMNIGYRES